MGISVAGRKVLVTGASSGLGRHFAAVLAAAGARVAVGARRVADLHAAVPSLASPAGPALAVQLDVTSTDSVEAAVRSVADSFDGLDVLVNNAGVAVTRPALEQTDADWDTVLDTNLGGAWRMARAAARVMARQGGGSIVNVASVLGLTGTGGLAGYVASKHGLVGLTRALACDLARYGVRVNALAPGYVVTPLNAAHLEGPAGEAIRKRIPLRRFARLEDLDGPLLLLASEASRYMTGSVVTVDGGHTASA